MKHKQNIEEEIILKKWFLSKPFIDKFLPNGLKTHETGRLCNTLGIELARLQTLAESDNLISATTADKYAVKMRISSFKHMV
jgi:hypothetical protein